MTLESRSLLVLLAFTGSLAACDQPPVQGFAFVSDINGAYHAEGPIGSTVIVEGIQFGDVQGSSQVLFSNSLGSAILPAPVSQWNNTFIVGTVPTGAVSGAVTVDNGNGANTLQIFNVTPASAFSPTSITSWTSAAALPASAVVSGAAVATGNIRSGGGTVRAIYVVGGEGSSGTPVASVYVSTIPAAGPIGAWTTTTAMPVSLTFSAAVVATPGNSADSSTQGGHLLVIGGATDSAGTSTDAVYRGTIKADGTILAGSWSQSSTLPAKLHAMGATIFLGHLYVWGGAGSNNTPVTNVYRAVIQPDGSIKPGDWTSQPGLPSARSRFGYGQYNGALYVFGGDGVAHSPNDSTSASASATVYYAKVDLYSRNVGAWATNPNSLPSARMAGGAVVMGPPGSGSAIVFSGLSASGSNDVYATINADGTVGTFANLAANLPTPVYNAAATGYVDGNGGFHALVAGGASRTAPATRTGAVVTAP
ncbi:MAG TPA: hypothetical protein VLT79_12765 [Gemmatimonadales bacterium]|nr:hypothetical protein [Gemmatimonadales bacterium]